MLSSRFGYTTSGKFICEKCHFVGKNRLALSVHKRTCDKTHTEEEEEVGDVTPINIQLTLPPPPAQQPIVQDKQTKTLSKKGASPSPAK